MDPILKDKRFARVSKDPRFRKMPKAQRRVKIDDRFKPMFKDKRFKMKYSVDKRGRPINLTTNENLMKYYELSDDDGEAEDGEDDDGEGDRESQQTGKQRKRKAANKNKAEDKVDMRVTNDSDSSSEEDSSESDSAVEVQDGGVDFARGENVVDSSSSDDDTTDDDDDEGDGNKIDHRWGEADDNITAIHEATHRLAVCNMDWDRIKAKDIFVTLNSFKPTAGRIVSVKIYPSEFGKERMAEEEKQGPQELKEIKLTDDDVDEEETELKDGTRYHIEKLREYQLKRLRYYYAVVECDSVTTADEIYKECDGMEFESSSTKLDLRFIPEDMEFVEQEVKCSCTEAPAGYKPQFFVNSALSQSKVDLTWDETDRDRAQLTSQQFTKKKGESIEEDDLKAYLASSSDEDDDDAADDDNAVEQDSDNDSDAERGNEDTQINKYKLLLEEIDNESKKSERDVQMEITWETGLRETTESLVKKKKQSKSSTVWDQYLEKKKEKKKKKQEERQKKKQARMKGSDEEEDDDDEQDMGGDGVDDDQVAFSDDEIPGSIDRDDPFFTHTDTSTNKKNKKKKKGKKNKNKGETSEEGSQEKAELSLLMLDEEKDDKKHFNYNDVIQENGKKKKKKKKGKKTQEPKPEEDFKVDISDPRFSAMYESHLYNIDPAAAEYKHTKGTEAIIEEKLKRSKNKSAMKRSVGDSSADKTQDRSLKKAKLTDNKPTEDSLASLVKSVKAKTKHFHSNKVKR